MLIASACSDFLVGIATVALRRFASQIAQRELKCVLLGIGVVLAMSSAQAQIAPPAVELRGVAEIIADYENSESVGLSSIMWDVHGYSRARIDSLLDGIERLVSTAKFPATRASAAFALGNAASAGKPVPGVFDRLVGLYSRSSDELVKRAVVWTMADQRERVRAIAFLKSVATEKPDQEDFTQASVSAVSTLSRMGAVGRSALLELRDAGAIHDPRASGFVNWYFRRKK